METLLPLIFPSPSGSSRFDQEHASMKTIVKFARAAEAGNLKAAGWSFIQNKLLLRQMKAEIMEK